MAYPYPHRNRAQGSDQIELYKLGTDSGTPVSCASATGTDGYSKNIDLPYNRWNMTIVAWATSHTDDITFKVYPWVDHNQTIRGNALGMSELGDSSVGTVITLSATATGSAGAAFNVHAGTGSLADLSSGLISGHGFNIVVSTTDATGTFDAEVISIPEG